MITSSCAGAAAGPKNCFFDTSGCLLFRLAIRSSYTAVRAHVNTENVIVDNSRPRRVAVEWLVKLGGNLSNERKLESGYSRKIMVLVVVPNVERHKVEPAVIGIGFLVFHKRVVFGNKMPSDGMNSHPEKSSQNIKEKGLDPKDIGKCRIEG